jgi:hypothetical protein
MSSPGSSTGPSASDQAKQATALKAQQASQVAAQNGNTQSATGGSLTPNSFTATSAKSAGLPSDLNSIMSYLGGSGSANAAPISGGVTSTNGADSSTNKNNLQALSDLLKG